ncbi:MAG: LacI family DNA-binding transcriptional regulator [Pseudomonadales bacterium]|nr:LacI family DNA-binding transcriptional regulator [Pseudomonadales bacterium]
MAVQKPTSLDIAAAAGVSQATVSRALRDSPQVSEETRERVKKAARELGYIVNRNAAGLRTQQTNVLAVLLFDELGQHRFEANPFFLSMFGSISHAAAELKYDVLVTFQEDSENWHHDLIVANRADGIILLGYGDYRDSGSKFSMLTENECPYVLWGPDLPELKGKVVGCNNIKGGRLATEHLLSTGRNKIAFVGEASASSPEFLARFQGYSQTLTDAGIAVDPALQFDAHDEQEGYLAGLRLLASGCQFDGVFAVSDSIAIGVMRALKEADKRIPDDIALVGFDDLPLAAYVEPSLTTVRQDCKMAGQLLVHSLVSQIHKKAPGQMTIEPELIVRQSS